MLFSLEWLFELCPVDSGPDRVRERLTARGLTVDALTPRGSDHVLDIDVPANRPDCLGHLGLARELGAAFGVPLAPSPPALRASGTPVDAELRLEVASPTLCPRYTAGVVRGVRIGPSPAEVVRRLEVCGLRSVNNVVDASNLVMLELGLPVHFFDLERLASPAGSPRLVRVRPAAPGERLRTLDGVERSLPEGALVIADTAGPIALAGVLGGAHTEIGPQTRHVLVEAACFDARSVRATSRALGVVSDAAFRFARGVDPAGQEAAQRLAARLLAELARGVPAPGLVDARESPGPPRQLVLRAATLRRLLGCDLKAPEVGEALQALGLAPEPSAGGHAVTVPSYRLDLEREADLVEEVARHVGYERIPTVVGSSFEPAAADAAEPLADRLRDRLASRGFQETLGYSMIADGEDAPFVEPLAPAPLRLTNPIAEPLACLRRSMLPGLLRAADFNFRRGASDLRLFEIGSVFLTRGPGALPAEPRRLGLLWSGAAERPHWSRPGRTADLYDLIGLAEELFEASCPAGCCPRVSGPVLPGLDPERSVLFRATDGTALGSGGALHQDLVRRYEHEALLLEVDLEALARLPGTSLVQRPLPRVPAVTRDLSLVLERDIPYAELCSVLETVEAPAPVSFELVDRYRGAPLAHGESALTVRLRLEPLERTLTDAETDVYCRALVERLATGLGIRLRV